MNIEQLNERISRIEQEVRDEVRAEQDLDALRAIESKILGKEGTLGTLLAAIKDYPPDDGTRFVARSGRSLL